MNLLEDPWIPVRADSGRGEFRLLTYRDLLCEPSQNWQVSLPRDDLELACLQLLVCMTQVIFLPKDDAELRTRIASPLNPGDFIAAIAPYADWFDLDHPTQPFMQTRGVHGEWTSMQKLLAGLPEVTSKSEFAHCFFNEVTEARYLSGALAAIALFNQASNCPSFGGGFKGSLRGAAPVTTLLSDADLRRMIWRNVLTHARLAERQIDASNSTRDKPVWVEPISEKSTIHWNQIGLMRGLFWQPAHVELVKSEDMQPCDVLGGDAVAGYSGFRKAQFGFNIAGVWPHPHGVMQSTLKKGVLEHKFVSFSTSSPAWTQLSEFVVPRSINILGAISGCVPAGPISQADQMGEGRIELLVGGYRVENGAAYRERRHELIGLAQGWLSEKRRIERLVAIGLDAKNAIRRAIFTTSIGLHGAKGTGLFRRKRGTKKIRSVDDANGFHDHAEKLFYARTESLIHQTFSSDADVKEWSKARGDYAERITQHCRGIFEELTAPYAMKQDLIPVIAWSRRSLNTDLQKLLEDHT